MCKEDSNLNNNDKWLYEAQTLLLYFAGTFSILQNVKGIHKRNEVKHVFPQTGPFRFPLFEWHAVYNMCRWHSRVSPQSKSKRPAKGNVKQVARLLKRLLILNAKMSFLWEKCGYSEWNVLCLKTMVSLSAVSLLLHPRGNDWKIPNPLHNLKSTQGNMRSMVNVSCQGTPLASVGFHSYFWTDRVTFMFEGNLTTCTGCIKLAFARQSNICNAVKHRRQMSLSVI